MDFEKMLESAPELMQGGKRIRSGTYTMEIAGTVRTFRLRTADNIVPPAGQRIAQAEKEISGLEAELAQAEAEIARLEKRIASMERAQRKRDGKK